MKMLSFFIALLLRGKQENVSTNRRKTWPNIMTLSFRSSASARDFVNFYREIKAGSNTIESIDVEKIKKFSKVRSQTEGNDFMFKDSNSWLCKIFNLSVVWRWHHLGQHDPRSVGRSLPSAWAASGWLQKHPGLLNRDETTSLEGRRPGVVNLLFLLKSIISFSWLIGSKLLTEFGIHYRLESFYPLGRTPFFRSFLKTPLLQPWCRLLLCLWK